MSISIGTVVILPIWGGVDDYFRNLTFAEVRELEKDSVVWVPVRCLDKKMKWDPIRKWSKSEEVWGGYEALQCVRFQSYEIKREATNLVTISTDHGNLWNMGTSPEYVTALCKPLDESALSTALENNPQIRATLVWRRWQPVELPKKFVAKHGRKS